MFANCQFDHSGRLLLTDNVFCLYLVQVFTKRCFWLWFVRPARKTGGDPIILVDLALICANAVLVTILLRAAATKIVKPSTTASALRELVPALPPKLPVAVRVLAALEFVAAFTYAIPPARLPGQFLVALLGAGFVVLGVAGMVRGSSEPCGCFGAESTKPLGLTNIMMGVALVAAGAANLVVWPVLDAQTWAVGSALTAVVLSAGWLLISRIASRSW
ncbi:MauE/DoxX family redox-associated membrane protein [Fodinicola feengrottensis]|uniref:MauE/DoxX family redox-associated membrane protein n=1 Tax=Fodinicola feengrottensis TaxID=435914 RepID=UPI0036F2BD65